MTEALAASIDAMARGRPRPTWQHLLRDPAKTLFVIGTAGILTVGLLGLPLAIAGLFRPVIALPAVGIAWVLISVRGVRITLSDRDPSTLWSIAAVAIVAGFGLFAGLHSSQNLLAERDPGVYTVTGQWVADHGNLLYNTGLGADLLNTLDDGQSRAAAGIYPGPNGNSYFQFQHLPAVSLALAKWIGGDGAAFRSIAAVASVAMLGVYVVARRFVGARLALVPLALAVAHPAFLHFAKDVYSEWFAMAFALAAFFVWVETRHPASADSYRAAGILLGAGTLARVDAWWTATAFMLGLLLLVLIRAPRTIEGRQVRRLVIALVAVASIGALDLVLRSPEYLEDLRTEALGLLIVFATVGSALFLASHMGSVRHEWMTVRRLAPPVLAVLLAMVGSFALFLRPNLDPVRSHSVNRGVEDIQEAEGLPIDGRRTYAESSLEWLARYQGHVPIAFAVVASGLATFLMLRGRANIRLPILVAYIAAAFLYIWRPSITPDHLWSLRRFLPIILPLAFIFSTYVGRLISRHRVTKRYASSASLLLLSAALVQSLITGWPIANTRTQIGMLDATDELCQVLPRDSVVLMDETLGITWAGAVRTRCDVPVTRLAEPGIVDDVQRAGLRPVAVTLEPVCGSPLGQIERRYEETERVLTGVPDEIQSQIFEARVTELGSGTATLPTPIPDSAVYALQATISTTWTPRVGSSIIISMGPYLQGLWLEYRPTGVVELWVATNAGPISTILPDPIDDGEPRVIGGYVTDGTLHAVCGGQVVDEVRLVGVPYFADFNVRIGEVRGTESGNVFFQGVVDPVTIRPESQSTSDRIAAGPWPDRREATAGFDQMIMDQTR